jgi:hypothetical protein
MCRSALDAGRPTRKGEPMERRAFLRGSAALAAGLAVTPFGDQMALAGRQRIRWGALCLPAAGQSDQIEAVKALERRVGRRFATTHFRLPWERSVVNPFTEWSVRSGHTPIISWFTRKAGGGFVSWRSIAQGDHDGYIANQARSLRAKGWSGYFCFHKEPENEGNAKDWKDAHDRVYQIFRNVGARFRFIPTLTAYTFDGGNGGANAWLPNRYELLGVDGYNRYNCSAEWRSFGDIFRPAREFARRKNKGLYLIEYGCTEGESGRKADWLRGARRKMKKWPEIVGCSYNHEVTDCNYRVDTSAKALNAFAEMGSDRRF